ncbi:Bax inhibitor-1/YccA family protein [Elioraea sp.]|uniref:Bax inhibitor-1/YccA family protein n=1 Tax=Elioraea sp. TaxID=2185103 RepID=UPI0038D185CD
MAWNPDTRSMAATQTVPSAGVDAARLDAGLRKYMLGVYNYMASGLLLSGIIALLVASSPAIAELFYTRVVTARGAATIPTALGWVAMLSPLALVLVLSFGVNKMSKTAVQGVYWAFTALMGVSLANIFMVYTGASVSRVFFITAGTFAAMSIIGYTTQRDLTKMGSFLMMGLIGIILASVVNIFIGSSALQFAVSVIGVVIFVGLIAFDTQRIKTDYISYSYAEGTDIAGKRAVFDALSLYLNFVNLFQLLMSLLGQRQSE